MEQGHRARIRKKILQSRDLFAFQNYEILEALLFFCFPRKDVKSYSKSILSDFNDCFSDIMFADTEKLLQVEHVNDNFIFFFKIMREILFRIMHEPVKKSDVISNWSDLIKYIKFSMGFLKTEQVRILFLNNKNYIIANEIHSRGDASSSVVLIREIIKRVIFYDASSIIMIHNHPSGFSYPSEQDIKVTKYLSTALNSISVNLHDHVIITQNDYFSFRNNLII